VGNAAPSNRSFTNPKWLDTNLISIVQLGTVDYGKGLALQEKLIALRKEERIGDALLLLEHKPVITLGRNAKAANVVASPEFLKQRGVELYECDRGGDVTFHGPGQIVGYPIFDLRGFTSEGFSSGPAPVEHASTRKHIGVVEFVRRLEDVLMRTCADYAIPAKRVPGLTGVWTDPESATAHVRIAAAEGGKHAEREQQSGGHDFSRAARDRAEKASLAGEGPVEEAKLAAIGVHVSRGVTSHGFALNVNTDLSYFNLIIPCGITTKPVTSMQKELGKELELNFVAESISRNFGVVFQSQILWVDTLDALIGNTVGVPMKPPAEFRRLHGEDDTTWA
jgi:lipoyl(octanoyl) transferase